MTSTVPALASDAQGAFVLTAVVVPIDGRPGDVLTVTSDDTTGSNDSN